MKATTKHSVGVTLALCLGVSVAYPLETIRHALAGSRFPIVRAVEVLGNMAVHHLSGAVLSVTNDAVLPNTLEAYGDTGAQMVATARLPMSRR